MTVFFPKSDAFGEVDEIVLLILKNLNSNSLIRKNKAKNIQCYRLASHYLNLYAHYTNVLLRVLDF